MKRARFQHEFGFKARRKGESRWASSISTLLYTATSGDSLHLLQSGTEAREGWTMVDFAR
ncbi:hypothetical protein FRB91_007330 [Serendipita sp. 411]|nr:hypothetical protein FRB91_007330 [Serendipita sp. 411]